MSIPYMQLYVADYLADTRHLSTEQHGAYLLLLMSMWRAGGRLPSDASKLARIAGVSLRRWHLVWPNIEPLFDIHDDEIGHGRLEREHQKALSKSEKRSASGKLGGDAKQLKTKASAVAIATDLPCHSSDIRHQVDTSVSTKRITARDELEKVLSPELAQAVIDHRKAIRKPASAKAAKLLADEFAKCPDPKAAAETMIRRGWQGFEAEWMSKPQPTPGTAAKQTWMDVYQEFQDERRASDYHNVVCLPTNSGRP
jgi:uncharacterized protein YdaU (DUF1376 family)